MHWRGDDGWARDGVGGCRAKGSLISDRPLLGFFDGKVLHFGWLGSNWSFFWNFLGPNKNYVVHKIRLMDRPAGPMLMKLFNLSVRVIMQREG